MNCEGSDHLFLFILSRIKTNLLEYNKGERMEWRGASKTIDQHPNESRERVYLRGASNPKSSPHISLAKRSEESLY